MPDFRPVKVPQTGCLENLGCRSSDFLPSEKGTPKGHSLFYLHTAMAFPEASRTPFPLLRRGQLSLVWDTNVITLRSMSVFMQFYLWPLALSLPAGDGILLTSTTTLYMGGFYFVFTASKLLSFNILQVTWGFFEAAGRI